MLVSSPCIAADEQLGFRNVHLGDSVSQVVAASKKSFEISRPAVFISQTQASVLAGDSEGVKKHNCPVAESLTKPNCLAAFFLLQSVNNAAPSLVFISVEQRFSSPIPAKDFLQKVYKMYGTPRNSFAVSGDIVGNRELSETTLVWGGDKPVPKDFRFATTYAREVMRILGGTYANMLVIADGPFVVGYKLHIANSDTWGISNAQEDVRRENEGERRMKANIDSVQF